MADRVVFLRPDAERIARVVRTVENGDRDESPLRFRRITEPASAGKVFRIATFAGPWNINAAKTVAFKYQATTPNTASVTNLFFPLSDAAAGDCAIAKDGTAWFLIDVPFYTSTAVFARASVAQTALASLDIIAELNTTDCSITVTKTANTASITLLTSTFTASFVRLEP